MNKKSFAVIGLGQFGLSVVEELVDLGMDVMAIDIDEESVKRVADILPTAFVADSTDIEALKQLKVQDVDNAIVAFGSDREASILTTVLLKELGVPHIIVRVDKDEYQPIIKRIGATEVIAPQKAAGVALANKLGSDDYHDFYKLDNKYSVVSIVVNSDYASRTLSTLNSKDKFGVNIVLIVRDGRSFVPGGKDLLLPNDIIFVVGSTKEIRLFRESINGVKAPKKKKN